MLSKFIPGLSTIAPPLAGAMRVGWPSFLLLNALGVAIWAGIDWRTPVRSWRPEMAG